MRLRWVLALMVLASSCAGGGTRVTLDEYSVEAPAETRAGRVELDVRNAGSISHELNILRTSLDPSKLPLKDAEVVIRARGVELVNKTKRIEAGKDRQLVVTLRKGSYVLICNVPGHYQSGMRASFLVR